jgi:hypothetical protein
LLYSFNQYEYHEKQFKKAVLKQAFFCLLAALKGGFFFGKFGKSGLNIDNLNPIQHFEGLFSVEIGKSQGKYLSSERS